MKPSRSDGKASAYNAGDWVRSLGREDPLEKEMATYSSTLACKIPWMEDLFAFTTSQGMQGEVNDLAASLITQGKNQHRASSSQLLSGLTSFTLKSGRWKQEGERQAMCMAVSLHTLLERVCV